MNDMKRNVLFIFLLGVGFIFMYQFYLNFTTTMFKKDIKNKNVNNIPFINFGDNEQHMEDISLALKLSQEVNVLCWVMTSPYNHKTRAFHVMSTWGKRCNKLYFATESAHASEGLPILLINTTGGREHLTAKTMQTFDYLYRHHLNDYDWFMKADDDTYVILENLRYFLSEKDSSQPVYFGHHFQPYVKQGYFSGGGGYVISRAGLKKFGERKENMCTNDQGAEDVEIGKCMELVGVMAGDSRDVLGRSRFHCFTPMMHIDGGFPDWYYIYDTYGGKKGIESMSDYAITFHYVETQQMYVFEFFLFHLRPYGILYYPQKLNGPSVNSTNAPSYLARPITTLPPNFATLLAQQTPNLSKSNKTNSLHLNNSSQNSNIPSQHSKNILKYLNTLSQQPKILHNQTTKLKKLKRRRKK